MCIALRVQEGGKTKTVTFRQRTPTLPFIANDNKILYMPWGRSFFEKSNLPVGGWAREDFVIEGKWDAWFPKKILIPSIGFCILDFTGKAHWFDICTGEYLQAILVCHDNEQRLYLSIELTQRFDNLFWHWPLIVRKPSILINT